MCFFDNIRLCVLIAGVDLNRNCILDADAWKAVRSRPADFANYTQFDSFLNPARAQNTWLGVVSFWWTSLSLIAIHGLNTLKAVVVTGQYWKKEGIFYGGPELQPSHQLLHKWMSKHVELSSLRSFALVDVHTGLRPLHVHRLQQIDSIQVETIDDRSFHVLLHLNRRCVVPLECVAN